MHFLTRFGIFGRIMMAAVLIASVSVLIAALGIAFLRSQNAASHDIERASLAALAASKLVAHSLAMNSAEFQLAGNPSNRTVEVIRTRAAVHMAEIRKQIQELRNLSDPKDATMIEQIAKLLRDYEREVGITLGAAQDVVADRTSINVDRLLREAEVSQELVGRFYLLAQNFVMSGEERVRQVTDRVQSMYEKACLILGFTAGIGIMAGLYFAYSGAKRGILEPVRSVTDVLQRLAHGDLPSDIDGAERNDEVGALAQAAMGIRERAKSMMDSGQGAQPSRGT